MIRVCECVQECRGKQAEVRRQHRRIGFFLPLLHRSKGLNSGLQVCNITITI